MTEPLCAVIMAGGGGTRLWPMSTVREPKQTLALIEERSLFQISVDRILPLIAADRILVVTIEQQMELLQQQAPELPESSFLLEPEPKGTAAVIGLAAIELRRRHGRAVMAVLTADHFIEDEMKFRELVSIAVDAAEQGDLVTLGIRPSVAATGYGYLERGASLGNVQGVEIFRVNSFREKPDEQTAKQYLQGGNHFWNSGMFFWRVDRILDEIDRHMPELSRALGIIDDGWEKPDREVILRREWEALQNETIDFGVMEKVDRVSMVEAEGLGWYDLGSWSRLFDVLDTDKDGNLLLAPETITLETSGSLIAQSPGIDRLVATLGVKDLIIVDTGKAILVASKHRAQDIRQLVDRLEREGKVEYL